MDQKIVRIFSFQVVSKWSQGSEGEFVTHLGPTRLEGLVSAIARKGYPVYAQ
jgi:hypothetical protein